MRDDQEQPTIPARRDPLIGTILDGRFRVDDCLAAGGFGGIYRAVDVRSGGEVALKVLHGSLTRDPACVRRFRREGALLLTLRDPHTLAAHELGEPAVGGLYIVMELLHGQTVYERLVEYGPMPWERVVEIGLAACSSLAEAHAHGVVHRDLKPANIFLERRGDADFVKLLDFGIAKIVRSDVDHTALTAVGYTIGTVAYMSPEQIQGDPCTPRSDIYSLGVVLYELLVGVRPYPNTDAMSLLAAMLTGPPPAPRAPTPIPTELARVVMACLAFAPNERYNATALATALERLGDDDKATTVRADHAAEAPTQFVLREPPRIEPPPRFEPPRFEPRFEPPRFEPARIEPPRVEQPSPRPSQARYELEAVTKRDAWMRRIVWALVIVVCIVIVEVLASR